MPLPRSPAGDAFGDGASAPLVNRSPGHVASVNGTLNCGSNGGSRATTGGGMGTSVR